MLPILKLSFRIFIYQCNFFKCVFYFVSLWNALRAVGKKKKKKRINLSLLRIWSGFWGSCGLGDIHKFISKMTTTAECCHLSCELLHIQMIFQELQVSSYAKHKCLAQLPQDQVVAGIDARPHHFLRRSSAPGPYLIAALVSLFLSFGEHDVCLVTCQKGLMNWSGNNESKKKKCFFCQIPFELCRGFQMARGLCKGRNEQGGGAPKPAPAVLLAVCRARRAGWAVSPPARALPERRWRGAGSRHGKKLAVTALLLRATGSCRLNRGLSPVTICS